jgi:ABC-type branched-subunit amino acid transport system substrate-binding protein
MRRLLSIALLVAACGGEDETTKEPVTIALIAPKSGALGFVGLSFERVAQTAKDKINAEGGINGRQLELIVLDDQTDAPTSKIRFDDAVAQGAVAVVGPATSGAVNECVDPALSNKVPLISPSSTAPSIADAADGGYVFRDVPNDNVQGIAMGYYMTLPDGLNATNAWIVREETVYGQGLAEAFEGAFMAQGGTVDGETTFTQGISAAQVLAVMNELDDMTTPPEFVVLIALEGDAVALMDEWVNNRPDLANVEWFFTDGARSQGFLNNAPAEVLGMKGTAPTYPVTGDAYSELAEAYDARWTDNLNDQVYAANVWDAVYLLAAAIAYQDEHFPGEPIGGEHLRDAITTVSRGPGQIFHAGQWADMMSAVARGDDIDYDGASGPVDFDDDGEAIGPYEVWTIVEEGGVRNFQQLEYLDAQDLMNL